MSKRPVCNERVIDKNIILNLEKSVINSYNGGEMISHLEAKVCKNMSHVTKNTRINL